VFEDASAGNVEAADSACRKALFVTDPAADRQSLIDKKGLRVTGTCQWMQDNEIYKTWLYGDPGLLWVFGGPGKGKTMLSIYLTQQFEKRQDADTMYFFCSSEHSTRSTATAVMRTLLWQMTVKRPDLAHLVTRHFHPPERTQAMLSTPGSLWEVFTELIQSVEFKRMQCLIDGLDECDGESARWLASQFVNLAREGNNGNLHLIVVSRLMSSAAYITKIHIDPDNDHNVNSDIGKFTSLKMQELTQRIQLSFPFRTRVEEELLKKAEGTFLWIGYAMSELLTKTTSLEVEEAVTELPTALPGLYDRMLRRIAPEKLKMVTALLHWVALAVRPLSFPELADAINWQHDEQKLRDLVKICKPFLSVQHEKVVLVHQSAKDYLLRGKEDDDAALKGVKITIADVQLNMAKTCLNVLAKSSSLYSYASSHWPHHLRQCSRLGQSGVVESDPFFKAESAARREWWDTYCMIEEHRHIFDGDELSELHIACFLDLETWARSIMPPRLAWCEPRTLLGRIPLHYAILGGGTEVVPMLLSCGQGPYVQDSKLATAIWYATVLAQELNLKLLLEFLATETTGRKALQRKIVTSALVAAVKLNRAAIAETLLEQGADPDGGELVEYQLTLLQMAVLGNVSIMAQALLNHGADPRKSGTGMLLSILKLGHRQLPLQVNLAREKPIILATYLGRCCHVELLLDKGVSSNSASIHGFTLLQIAAVAGWHEIVLLLLGRGADANWVATDRAPCPLLLAIQATHEIIVNLLLDHGADTLTESEQSEWLPVFRVLGRDLKPIAPRLNEHGALRADISALARLLWIAILHRSPSGVIYALDRGTDPNTILGGPVGSLTALHWAVAEWIRQREDLKVSDTSRDTVKCLLLHGADPSLRDGQGKTVEQYAAMDLHVMRAFSILSRESGSETGAKELSQARGLDSRPNLQLLRSGGVRPPQHPGRC
jgi:ankyrin repeat protein